jgi:hypothetical protein
MCNLRLRRHTNRIKAAKGDQFMDAKKWVQDVIRNRRNKKLPRAWWETAAEFPAQEESFGGHFDPLGSYTGTPQTPDVQEEEAPEQDADDL